ncbi:hypothetical protein H6F32_03475 [Anabaena sp. FACHB-1237]|uniref:lipid-A-disaccharide synthase-related protein n=1 Tax=Anabaena sp. FACHB-1237 TaxID=2692769 RepID=UPI0016806B81|nr:lipid-A-disaccharide synthase-related protein [Anabaena sp. FACHB-1237]MBD2136669.1 hypothetical protein [Anabaena sp. FACHB-1237]
MNNSCLNLLVLSNGHGEDIIAVRIIQALRNLSTPVTPITISALPIVGEGLAYQKINVPIIGKVQNMPSGGFIYMDSKELMRDVSGGLVQLTWSQIQTVRGWARHKRGLNHKNIILAVGDIVPLLFAAVSGANYAFVGTAKSEYYVQDELGLLSRESRLAFLEHFSGSIYHPWERWLMGLKRCLAVFPRDTLTTEILQKFSVPAFDVGNPMMDNLDPSWDSFDREKSGLSDYLVVTLLPGSRAPEVYNNWSVIMTTVSALMDGLENRKMMFLGAIAPGLDVTILSEMVENSGWKICNSYPIKISDNHYLTWEKQGHYIILTQSAYNDCLHLGDVSIAMAGTATEQFIGLGKPAIAIPGKGPQYNPDFAEAQSRLLGISLRLINHPTQVNTAMDLLLSNWELRQKICQNGQQRMGKPGAAKRIAQCLLNV